MKKSHSGTVSAEDVGKVNKITESLSYLDSLYGSSYRRSYKVGSSRVEDKKIKKNLRILFENNLLRQCGYGKKIDLTRSIDLHGCTKAAAYYFLCFNILSRNNDSLEELWTCHGVGKHNDRRADGTAIMSLPDTYQPLMEFFEGRVTAVQAWQNPAFEHLRIESAPVLTPPPLDIQFLYSKTKKVVETIDYQIIRDMSLNELQNKINKFYDAYYDYGINKDFDRVIDTLLTKLEELKPADYNFGPVDHFIQQREIFNTCEHLKHAGKEQEALALKASNIPSLSYHTFNLDSADDFATQQRLIAYYKIKLNPMLELASEVSIIESDTQVSYISANVKHNHGLEPEAQGSENTSAKESKGYGSVEEKPLPKAWRRLSLESLFEAARSYDWKKLDQYNGSERLKTNESIKPQVKENMSAEKSKDYASTEEKLIAEGWIKISLESLFEAARSYNWKEPRKHSHQAVEL